MAINASRRLTFEQALSRAAALCSTSEHCTADITDKLIRWGTPSALIKEVTNRLLDEGYIDEARYANAFARDKLRFSHWGRAKIRAMLRQQRIPDATISDALDALDPQEYADIANQVILSKARTTDFSDPYTAQAKIIRFALQRGFGMEDVRRNSPFLSGGRSSLDEMDAFPDYTED